jgi:dimethylamine monooxygenase subunit A
MTVLRAPPEEVVYRPYGGGPYRMSMDLVTVAAPAWFEIDSRYTRDLAEKRDLLATRRQDVFACRPEAVEACREARDMVVENLTATHPDWFTRDRDLLRNNLSREAIDLNRADPLEHAARLVQEDLCIIQVRGDVPVFTAGAVCFPSRWKLHEKIGKPLEDVHGPVPLYADRLLRPVDRFMQHLKPNRIACRLNWSLLDDPALFLPSGKWRGQADAAITPDSVSHRVYLRVERQTLRRLPRTGAVLFGIRVHVYPIGQVADSPRNATELAAAVRALPVEIERYKSLPVFKQALLTWLEARRG